MKFGRVKIWIARIAFLILGVAIGARVHFSSEMTSDAIHLGASAAEWAEHKTEHPLQSIFRGRSESNASDSYSRSELEKVPFSVIREVYDRRMDEAQKSLSEKFPYPTGEKEMRDQIEEAMRLLESAYSDKIYWSAKIDLPTSGKNIPIQLLFGITHHSGVKADPKSSDSGPESSSIFPETASMIPGKNICWNLSAFSPDTKSNEYLGGGSGGCLEHLSKKGNQFFVTVPMNGKEILKEYLSMAVAIPDPDGRAVKLFLQSTDSLQWTRQPLEVDWVSLTEEEGNRLLSERSELTPPKE